MLAVDAHMAAIGLHGGILGGAANAVGGRRNACAAVAGLAARAVGAAREPVTAISISGVCPTVRRRPAGTPTCLDVTLPRRRSSRMPLTSLARLRADSELTISLTVLGLVARPGTGALPFGEKGWPR
jgi:hypothetical protein